MCANCHADEELMAQVRSLPQRLQDLRPGLPRRHGGSGQAEGPDNWTDKAVCSDCHGVHDIQSVKDGDPVEIKKNMAATCQKCHPDAGTNFPDAWLRPLRAQPGEDPAALAGRGPSTGRIIPFMIGGLFLHMIVDLWRIARNR